MKSRGKSTQALEGEVQASLFGVLDTEMEEQCVYLVKGETPEMTAQRRAYARSVETLAKIAMLRFAEKGRGERISVKEIRD